MFCVWGFWIIVIKFSENLQIMLLIGEHNGSEESWVPGAQGVVFVACVFLCEVKSIA